MPPAELERLRTRASLIDVREPDEFTGPLGHLAGAELVPLPTVEATAQGWSRDAPLVLICRSGGRLAKAATALAARGFTRLYNLAGGMLALRKGPMRVRVGRREERLKRPSAELQRPALFHADVGASESFHRGNCDPAPGEIPQPARGRDVVCVKVRFENEGELQLMLLKHLVFRLSRVGQ